MKLKVYIEEVETLVTYKGPIEISEETHPELAGKTEEEVINYIKNNAWDMKPVESDDNGYDSLGEQLQNEEIIKSKYIPENEEFDVEIVYGEKELNEKSNVHDDDDEDDPDDDNSFLDDDD